MKTVILAGGLGKRLRSEVADWPKVMAFIDDKPFLEFQLMLLKELDFKDVVLCVGYKKEVIIDYFGDGSHHGINVNYSVEDTLLGTAGALKNAQQHLSDTFLVLNGDTYLEIDYNELVRFHIENKAVLTLALAEVEEPGRYGSVEVENDGKIISFNEKLPNGEANKIYAINAGVYVFEPHVLDYISPKTVVSLENDVIPLLLVKSLPVYGFITKGYFVDIGTPESYAQAREYFKSRS